MITSAGVRIQSVHAWASNAATSAADTASERSTAFRNANSAHRAVTLFVAQSAYVVGSCTLASEYLEMVCKYAVAKC